MKNILFIAGLIMAVAARGQIATDQEKAYEKGLELFPSSGRLYLELGNMHQHDLASLNRIREDFINFYYDRKFHRKQPNILFSWHKSLIDKGFFECYNYWLLMQGAPEEFNRWYMANEEQFNQFITWFTDNPMQIDTKHTFHRLDY